MVSITRQRITRREWLTLIGGATAGALLAACTRAPSTTGGTSGTSASSAPAAKGRAATKEMIFGQLHEVSTLNPIQRAADSASTEVQTQLFSELLHYDYKTAKLEPDLVENYRSKSPLVWELKLREGVKFHKGYGELTAEDVAFNVNYTIQNKALRENRFRFVKGARATGKYTVEYELERPFAPFQMSTLRGVAGQMVSKRAYEEIGEQAFGRNPIGTGPWQLESWKPGEIVIARHTEYHKPGLPGLDKITFIPVPDAYVRRTKIEAGEIDFMGQPDYKDIEPMRKHPNLVVDSVPGLNWDYIAFNVKDPSLPFQKQEVRQAISYAINREAIVKNVYLGEATPTDSPLPPGYLGYIKGPVKYPYAGDVEKAKALMAEAGLAGGFTVKCITSDKPNLRRELEIVADQLRQINVTVQIQGLDMTTYNNQRNKTEFEMLLEDISIVSTDSDDAFTNFQHSKGNINHGWVSAEADKLVDDARSMVGDDAGRERAYKRLVELTVEGAGYIYTVHTNVFRIMRKGLVGFESTPYEQELFLETMRWE